MYVYVNETVHVTGISLNKNSIKLTTAWQTQQLTATITPANADDQTVSWSSSNTSIATVSNTGLVTCVTPWTATITATTNDGGYTASCFIREWLPSAYQEVEYIESSGSQYIDTGFTPSVNTVIETDISWGTGQSDWAAFFWVTGNDSSSDGVLWRIYGSTASAFNPRFCNSDYNEAQINVTLNTFHNIILASNTIKIDWNLYTITTNWTPYQSSIDLFAWNNGGSHWWRKWKCKIKTFIITENWTLSRWFIPCYKIADTEIWLYDIINNQFYTNAWSWTFSKWADV